MNEAARSPGERPFLTVQELAELLDVTPVRVYQLVKAGEVPAIRVAGRIRIPRRAFETWLAEQSELALAAVAR